MIGSLLATIGAIVVALLFILLALAEPVMALHDLTPAPPQRASTAERAGHAVRQALAQRTARLRRATGRARGGDR